MKSKIIAVVLLVILSCIPNVEPTNTINITLEGENNLHGGDITTYFINISTQSKATINLTPVVSPSQNGFSISLSDNNFILNGEKTVIMTVHIDPYVLGTYTIGVNYTYTIHEKEESSGSNTIYTSQNDNTDDNQSDDNSTNDTKNNNNTDNNTNNNTTENNNTDNNNTDDDPSIPVDKKAEDKPLIIYIILVILSIATMILLFLIYKKKRRNKQ